MKPLALVLLFVALMHYVLAAMVSRLEWWEKWLFVTLTITVGAQVFLVLVRSLDQTND